MSPAAGLSGLASRCFLSACAYYQSYPLTRPRFDSMPPFTRSTSAAWSGIFVSLSSTRSRNSAGRDRETQQPTSKLPEHPTHSPIRRAMETCLPHPGSQLPRPPPPALPDEARLAYLIREVEYPAYPACFPDKAHRPETTPRRYETNHRCPLSFRAAAVCFARGGVRV